MAAKDPRSPTQIGLNGEQKNSLPVPISVPSIKGLSHETEGGFKI